MRIDEEGGIRGKRLRRTSVATPVPVENRGGAGTREGRWRDLMFVDEMMKGFINLGANPLNRVTVAALQDLGYRVDLASSEPFQLPTPFSRHGTNHQQCCCASGLRRGITPLVLPESAYVK